MPRNTSKSELKNEVLAGMRRYLGHHPELAFTTALELTKLVIERTTGKALLEWRDRIADLNSHATGIELVEPVAHSPRKRLRQRRHTARKA